MADRFRLDQIYHFDFAPPSRMVGIDRYTMYRFTGGQKDWPSYTFVSDRPGTFARWWMTDEPAGLFCWTSSTETERGTLVLEECGLCKLIAEGDTVVETPYSSVLLYEDKGIYFCVEVFEGGPGVLRMQGKKVSL